MTQHAHIALDPLPYTRGDYAALRAYCLKLPLSVIERYYSEDSPQRQSGLERYLTKMRDDLVEHASAANPAIAEVLKHARKGGSITDKALAILIEAAEAKPALPYPDEPIAKWLRARVANCLKQEGVTSLRDLMTLIETRGHTWWRGISRIGALRAQAILNWLNKHQATLGTIAPQSLQSPSPAHSAPLTVLNPEQPEQLAPLSHIIIPNALSGEHGINRCSEFCFIQASNDHEAVLAYLSRYKGQAHTHRAYQKELERFLLWAVLIAKKPLSSLRADECEAYKDFIAAPSLSFIGQKHTSRFSPRWKPFSGPLSSHSQRYATQILRAAFQWLVEVRYLAGNPWSAVRDPAAATAIHLMQIERALPATLWEKLIDVLTQQSMEVHRIQERIALAAILLMGDSGLRRSEAASACRHYLRQHTIVRNNKATIVWVLKILGKRNKWREVPISDRTMLSLEAHWLDRGRNIHLDTASPLLSPLAIPLTPQALKCHGEEEDHPYTSHSLYRLVSTTLKKLATSGYFNSQEKAQLSAVTVHAFRHTFGTQSIAQNVPIDVVQKVLGHVSVSTTSIYVQAERERMLTEVVGYYEKRPSHEKSVG